MSSNTEVQLLDSLFLELRRGTIVLSVLSQLDQPKYGYALVVILEEKGIKVEPGTLYPLLRRLEKQELLTSSWDTKQTKPRKYYELSSLGKRIYHQLSDQWLNLVEVMKNFIDKEDEK